MKGLKQRGIALGNFFFSANSFKYISFTMFTCWQKTYVSFKRNCIVRPLCLLFILSLVLWLIPIEWRQWSMIWWILTLHVNDAHAVLIDFVVMILQGRDDEEGEPERKRALAEEAEEKHRWRTFLTLLIKWTVIHACRGDEEGYCYKTGSLGGCMRHWSTV